MLAFPRVRAGCSSSNYHNNLTQQGQVSNYKNDIALAVVRLNCLITSYQDELWLDSSGKQGDGELFPLLPRNEVVPQVDDFLVLTPVLSVVPVCGRSSRGSHKDCVFGHDP